MYNKELKFVPNFLFDFASCFCAVLMQRLKYMSPHLQL